MTSEKKTAKLFTIKEAAKEMRVSAALVYALCGQKLLSHYRFGMAGKKGKIMISQEDIDSFMTKNRVEAIVPKE